MMRLLSILLLSVILVQSCGNAVIFVNYKFNKKEITEKYCVNKSNPMLHCDGMCHMIIQLQKEEKQENIPVKSQNEKIEIILFSNVKEGPLFNDYITGGHAYSIFQLMKITFAVSFVFHPPLADTLSFYYS